MANNKKLVATVSSTLERLIENFGGEYVIRQAAEECMELGQALLKYIRVMNGEITPVTPAEALDHVAEEIGDVTLMNSMVVDLLAINAEEYISTINRKVMRTNERLDAIANESGGDGVQSNHEKED